MRTRGIAGLFAVVLGWVTLLQFLVLFRNRPTSRKPAMKKAASAAAPPAKSFHAHPNPTHTRPGGLQTHSS
ncbi:MAG: hypothetical protein WBC04_01655 [Candidatus Acidiferrales bacterium]